MEAKKIIIRLGHRRRVSGKMKTHPKSTGSFSICAFNGILAKKWLALKRYAVIIKLKHDIFNKTQTKNIFPSLEQTEKFLFIEQHTKQHN